MHLDQLIYLKHLALRYLSDTMSPCQHHDASKNQDTCILLECNRACKIHLRYIRIHSRYVYPSGYMQDTSRYITIHQDTYPI